ncbi:YeeE/YedE thiosulfate transporter family protein [Sandarakinorhabdus sp. AAP62]|uniref:YeeE/YedE thiosulfate transporter family protein n=1 Tax=Sandarakinorhabdus sp. AAP62 TaxID=1248916 RepID=UPI0002F9851F|nr:YeeE/YedE thiosulfate transporter family protein [Sandarakinorhabdus sp. AAP62]
MMLMLACVFAAAIVGFAAHQGGTCGVLAVRHWIDRRDARLLIGFVLASGAATLVCLPLAWMLGRGATLPGNAPLGLPLVLGGVLLGVGAVVNGACLVGSLWRMGNGEVHLIGLPVGIVAGDMLGRALGWRVMVAPSRFAHPDRAGLMLVAMGAVLLALAWRWLVRQGPDARRLAVTMAMMGGAGSLLFVAMPGWTWADVVIEQVQALASGHATGGSAPVRVTLATLAGALASGWMAGQLHVKWRGWLAVVRSLLGGLLMMLGIGLIPGGNDALLLGSAPAGAISALLAFGVMNLTILVLASAGQLNPAAPPARH